MHRFLPALLLYLTTHAANARITDDWRKLRNQAHSIGVDSLCAQPGPACLTHYFTQIVYGRTPRRMSYRGLSEHSDTVQINRLTHQFLAGAAFGWGRLVPAVGFARITGSALPATDRLLYALSGG